MTSPVELYTDGSSLRNPGPSGMAYIIRWYVPQDNSLPQEKELSNSKSYRLSTNNRMEVLAVIEGLQDYTQNYRQNTFQDSGQLNVFSDSEYLCNAINKRWIDKWQSNNWMTSGFQGSQPKPVANRDLWERLIQSLTQIRNMGINVTFNHVNGHSGDPLNERCDQLANQAAQNTSSQLTDDGYEQRRSQYQNTNRGGWK